MIFTNLWPLLFLLLIPVAIILYFFRPKGKDQKIPSLLLWERVLKENFSIKKFEKFEKNIMLFLNIAIILALMTALMGPRISAIKGVTKASAVVVIDSTASMNSVISSRGKTKLDLAKEDAEKFIDGLNGELYLVKAGDTATVIAASSDKSVIKAAINNIEAFDGKGNISEAYNLAMSLKQDKIAVFTDKEGSESFFENTFGIKSEEMLALEGDSREAKLSEQLKDVMPEGVSVFTVGSDTDYSEENVSIAFLSSKIDEEEFISVAQVNNSSKNENYAEVSLYGCKIKENAKSAFKEGDAELLKDEDYDKELLSIKTVTLKADGSKSVIFEPKEAKAMEKYDFVKAELTFEEEFNDSLINDNVAFDSITKNKTRKAILIGNKNTYLEKAYFAVTGERIDRADSDIGIPAEYSIYIYTDATKVTDKDHSHLVFSLESDRLVDAVMPQASEDEGEDNEKTLTEPEEYIENMTAYVPESELTDGLKAFNIGVLKAAELEVPEWATSCIYAGDSTIAYYGNKSGKRNVVVGFDISDTNFALLPEFPVFVQNALNYIGSKSAFTVSSVEAGTIMLNAPTERAGIVYYKGNVGNGDEAEEVSDSYLTVRFPDKESAVNGQNIAKDGSIYGNEEIDLSALGENVWKIFALVALVILIIEILIRARNYGFKRSLLSGFSLAMCVVIVLSLIGIKIPIRKKSSVTVFAVDYSISNEDNKRAIEDYISAQVKKKPKNNEYAIVIFGKGASAAQFVTNKKVFNGISTVVDSTATDIESGVNLAVSLIPEGNTGKVVVLTDGRETRGSIANSAPTLASRNVELCSIIYDGKNNPDVYIKDAKVPGTVHPGEMFRLNATVYASYETDAVLEILKEGEVVEERSLHLEIGENTIMLDQESNDEIGTGKYELRIRAEGDEVPEDNNYNVAINVENRPRVLCITDPEQKEEVDNILSSIGTEYDIIDRWYEEDLSLSSLLKYKAVILNNVLYSNLPKSFGTDIENYVSDYGGGFIMTGGYNSFGQGGYKDTEIEKILPVDMTPRGLNEIPSLGVIMVIDRSGSMESGLDYGNSGLTKLDIVKKAAVTAVGGFSEKDYVGVIAFDSEYRIYHELNKLTDKGAVISAINSIPPGGGTTITGAMDEAVKQLERCDAQVKHILLLSDGSGDFSWTKQQYKHLEDETITVSTIALGVDADKLLMKEIADRSSGQFYFIEKANLLPEVFAKETYMAGSTYVRNGDFPLKMYSSKFLEGLEEDMSSNPVPNIKTYIAATQKGGVNRVIETEEEDPILTTWQYGLGHTVAFNTTVSSTWNEQMASWSEYQALWKRMLDFATTSLISGDNAATAEKVGDRMRIRYVVDEISEGTSVEGKYTDPDGKTGSISFSQTEPGIYEAYIDADDMGMYEYVVTKHENGEVSNISASAFSIQYSDEYRPDVTNDSYLKVLRLLGNEITEEDNVWGTLKKVKGSAVDLSKTLLILALALLILDIVSRQLGIEPLAMVSTGINRLTRRIKDGKRTGNEEGLKKAAYKKEDAGDGGSSGGTRGLEGTDGAEGAGDSSDKPDKKAKKKEKDNKKKNKPSSGAGNVTGLDTSALLKKKNERNI